jgi:anti-anti-sigma factor
VGSGRPGSRSYLSGPPGRAWILNTPHCETIVTDLPGDRWLVTLEGDHDLATAEDLRGKLRAIFQTGTTVVIDLSPTTFIDSSTLAVLLQAEEVAREQQCEHVGVVVPKNSPADRVFALVRAHRMFTIFETVEQGFAFFESASDDPGTAERWWERKQRIVKNEQAFRDYNDHRLQHEAVDADDDQEPIPFVCECGDTDCIQALLITAAGFTDAHSAPNRFIVKPGHVYHDVERIISETDTFAVVEKHPAVVRQAD